jgi:hypothetical protein
MPRVHDNMDTIPTDEKKGNRNEINRECGYMWHGGN